MKHLYIAALAAVFGLGSMGSVAMHAALHPAASSSGIFGGSALPALADEDGDNHGNHENRGRGHGRGRGHRNKNGNCNQSYPQYGQQQYGRQQGDQDDENEGDGNRGRTNCGTYGNGGYGNGGYGNGRTGNGTISGLIVGVNGSRVTVQQGFSNRVTIDDQPALDRQQTGRIYVGRSITASGYYQNGIFYATSIR